MKRVSLAVVLTICLGAPVTAQDEPLNRLLSDAFHEAFTIYEPFLDPVYCIGLLDAEGEILPVSDELVAMTQIHFEDRPTFHVGTYFDCLEDVDDPPQDLDPVYALAFPGVGEERGQRIRIGFGFGPTVACNVSAIGTPQPRVERCVQVSRGMTSN